MQTTSISTLRTVLLLASFAASVVAQPPGVEVSYEVSIVANGAVLRLQVASTISLSELLQAFCLKQNMQCVGTEYLSAFSVPGMTISGTTEEVLSYLLEGTGMNYSISRKESGRSLNLTVLGPAPVGTDYAGGPADRQIGRTDAAPTVQASHSMQGPATERDAPPEPESAEESARSEQAMRQMFGGATPDGGLGANVAPGASQVAIVNDDKRATNSQVTEYLPFPDEFGNPVPATQPAAPSFMPFPDHRGNPIPVTPTPTPGSPFPPPTH